MSKKPSKGGAPALDMTPMVDLAFLLVTFFMLTASFRMAEPVVVDPPSSIGQVDLPDNHIMVTIDDKGRAFFGISNSTAKMNALREMGKRYNVTFTEAQIIKFSGLPSIGVDLKDLPKYIKVSITIPIRKPEIDQCQVCDKKFISYYFLQK